MTTPKTLTFVVLTPDVPLDLIPERFRTTVQGHRSAHPAVICTAVHDLAIGLPAHHVLLWLSGERPQAFGFYAAGEPR